MGSEARGGVETLHRVQQDFLLRGIGQYAKLESKLHNQILGAFHSASQERKLRGYRLVPKNLFLRRLKAAVSEVGAV
jgi:hypothetical protein